MVVLLSIAVVIVLVASFMFHDSIGVSKAFGLNHTNLSYGNVLGGS